MTLGKKAPNAHGLILPVGQNQIDPVQQIAPSRGGLAMRNPPIMAGRHEVH